MLKRAREVLLVSVKSAVSAFLAVDLFCFHEGSTGC